MKDRYFLDTNILVYSFDVDSPKKQRVAENLIQTALETHRGIISTQVIQEFLNVALKKFAVPLTHQECRLHLQGVLAPLCEVYPSPELYDLGLDLHRDGSLSFYDALIVAAAKQGGCKRIYSEDMHHGRILHDLIIENPFV